MSRIKQFSELINERIAGVNFGQTPCNLYEPIDYIMKFGGKRIRPILTLLSCDLFNSENIDRAVDPALAVEYFHNFTLMHDDIMDHAPLRRGKPTVHEKWNSHIAMLSGDVMLVRVYDFFLGIQPVLMAGIIKKFNDCAARVCEGQQLDMNYESAAEVSEAEYLQMIRLKTAVLIGFSLELGAMLGGAGAEDTRLMHEFGINIGNGFQLRDDQLDVYAGSGFGKQVGGDILANKKTYLLVMAQARATGTLKNELDTWLAVSHYDKEEKIKSVTGIYDRLDINQITSRKIEEFFSKGFAAFNQVKMPEENKADLREFVENLIHREN